MNAPISPASTSASARLAAKPWIAVCALDDIIPASGVGALIDGKQVAIVRTAGDEVYALSNFDPFSEAMVMARGIVGDAKGVPKIASPIYKQQFDLRTGRCLDDPTVSIPTFPCRVRAGVVEIRA